MKIKIVTLIAQEIEVRQQWFGVASPENNGQAVLWLKRDAVDLPAVWVDPVAKPSPDAVEKPLGVESWNIRPATGANNLHRSYTVDTMLLYGLLNKKAT
jgi:hypothetical protein